MFEIYNNRKQFWQWDVGQRLIVNDDTCSEIHFCNGTSDCALVCEAYEEDGLRLVNVPSILFQTPKAIRVFAYVCNGEDQHTKREKVFPVFPRSKPEGYVYTETETLNFNSLSKRISKLEETPPTSIPAGGKAGQILTKKSDADGDVEWSDFVIPSEYGRVTYNQDKSIIVS